MYNIFADKSLNVSSDKFMSAMESTQNSNCNRISLSGSQIFLPPNTEDDNLFDNIVFDTMNENNTSDACVEVVHIPPCTVTETFSSIKSVASDNTAVLGNVNDIRHRFREKIEILKEAPIKRDNYIHSILNPGIFTFYFFCFILFVAAYL